MGGLVRTKSRSKSENSFFDNLTSHHFSLLEFYNYFESALDAQRHTQDKLKAECEGFFPEVLGEIFAACFYCFILSIQQLVEYVCYEVKGDDKRVFCVHHNPNDNSVSCGCIGCFLLCHHIYIVFKDTLVESIP